MEQQWRTRCFAPQGRSATVPGCLTVALLVRQAEAACMVTRGGGAHDGRGAQQRPWTRLHGNGIGQGMQPRLDGVDVWPGRVRVSAARRRTGLGRYGSAIRRAAGAVSLCRWLDGAPDCACWVVVLVGTAPLSQIERRVDPGDMRATL